MNFSITLTPLQSSTGMQEVHVKVDLHVVCSAKYPDAYVTANKTTTNLSFFFI